MSPKRDLGDASDQIRRAVQEEGATHRRVERFRVCAAVAIAVLAMLLAISSLGGENAEKEMINSNIYAGVAWDVYQAKEARQDVYQVAADRLEMEMAWRGDALGPAMRQDIQDTVRRYREVVARLESERDTAGPADTVEGGGKRELEARARRFEAVRGRAQLQDPSFDYSVAFFQIAIVLGSVAIVVVSPRILLLGLALGAVATLLMLNGFFLILPLPLG